MSACELSHFMDLNMCICFLKLNADLADDLYQKKNKKKTKKPKHREFGLKLKLLWLIDERPIPDAGATMSL